MFRFEKPGTPVFPEYQIWSSTTRSSSVTPEQLCGPLENARRWLFTYQLRTPLGMLVEDSIYTGDSTLESIRRRSPKWLPWRISASMSMRCPRWHWRNDGHSVTTMMTMMTPPHRMRRSLPRRNPPCETAPMTVAPLIWKNDNDNDGRNNDDDDNAGVTTMTTMTTTPSIS
jgi:hypothetical protein